MRVSFIHLSGLYQTPEYRIGGNEDKTDNFPDGQLTRYYDQYCDSGVRTTMPSSSSLILI